MCGQLKRAVRLLNIKVSSSDFEGFMKAASTGGDPDSLSLEEIRRPRQLLQHGFLRRNDRDAPEPQR